LLGIMSVPAGVSVVDDKIWDPESELLIGTWNEIFCSIWLVADGGDELTYA